MDYRIDINADNAAFEDAGSANEVARILRDLAGKLEREGVLAEHPLYDLNGNRVGLAANARPELKKTTRHQ